MTIATYHVVIGTKAQLVKMAPVLHALDRHAVPYRLVLTGQHQETMDDLISSFDLRSPDVVLYSASESDSARALAVWALRCSTAAWKMRGELKRSLGIVVHGDTLSTLWGALVGRLLSVPVVHIEAGLRSFRLFRPFPEEIVRLAVTRLATTLAAPGDWAAANLGTQRNKLVVNTRANTILDALRFALAKAETPASRNSGPRYFVVSVHRAENVVRSATFSKVMRLVEAAAEKAPIKFVLHPVTRRRLNATEWKGRLERAGVEFIPRTDYIQFIGLLRGSAGLLTDGGSNQEEAAYMGLPCLLLRQETERREGLTAGITVSNLDEASVIRFIEQTLELSWRAEVSVAAKPSDTIADLLAARVSPETVDGWRAG